MKFSSLQQLQIASDYLHIYILTLWPWTPKSCSCRLLQWKSQAYLKDPPHTKLCSLPSPLSSSFTALALPPLPCDWHRHLSSYPGLLLFLPLSYSRSYLFCPQAQVAWPSLHLFSQSSPSLQSLLTAVGPSPALHPLSTL